MWSWKFPDIQQKQNAYVLTFLCIDVFKNLLSEHKWLFLLRRSSNSIIHIGSRDAIMNERRCFESLAPAFGDAPRKTIP